MTTIIKPDGTEIEWTCPKCGYHDLEEVMIDVVVSSTINSIGEDGDIDYGFDSHEDGEVQSYQCVRCGLEIPGIKKCDALYSHLVEEENVPPTTEDR